MNPFPPLQKNFHVGIMIPSIGRYVVDILTGIQHFARLRPNWTFTLDPVVLHEPLSTLRDFHGDGVILFICSPDQIPLLRRKRIPAVNVSTAFTSPEIPLVAIDNEAVGRLAAQHLLQSGLRHFAFAGSLGRSFSDDRLRGFTRALDEAGHSCHIFNDVEQTQTMWGWTLQSHLQPSLDKWVRTLPLPIGIMGCHDARARQVQESALRLKLRMPDDIALIGANDDPLVCEFAPRPLSSIHLGGERIGYAAAELLDRLLTGSKPPARPLLFEPEAISARQSTDVLAVSDPDIVAAVRYIRANAVRRISVADVLRQVPISRRALERKFITFFGRSPHEEIRQTQLNRAKILLASTTLTMFEIARASGFRDVKHFYRHFAPHVGLPPAAYRKKHQRIR